MTNKKLLFVYTRLSTFVKADLDILKKEYIVTTICVDNSSGAKQLISTAKLVLYLIFNTYRFDLTYTWFADYHSFFPTFFAQLFRKKSYIVIGGYDVCRIKSLNYGSFVNPLRGYMAKYSMNHSSLNLCVSRHIERVVKFIAPDSKREILYNGINFISSSFPKEDLVLSVAISSSVQSFYIKGIDRFINACAAAEDIKFVIVGLDKNILPSLINTIPSNLEIIAKLPQGKLADYYSRAKVYCQLSRSESFAVSLAEAMYNNCVPVISYTGGMPEVAGDYGYIVNGRDNEEIVKAIRSAIALESSDKYRKRVVERFTIDIRKKALLKVLESTFES
jgi:glycosyltransferase involved in cell wall biosynthesis